MSQRKDLVKGDWADIVKIYVSNVEMAKDEKLIKSKDKHAYIFWFRKHIHVKKTRRGRPR